jgi:hypothetical protein
VWRCCLPVPGRFGFADASSKDGSVTVVLTGLENRYFRLMFRQKVGKTPSEPVKAGHGGVCLLPQLPGRSK